ncbi:delta aminolevulinic acid dehydratase [Echinococcus multilocularis]|uniref:Delta-aminolevulinic acid dehydratase n=1 Tax=Echinococcus multilocularis TaxID=6211 RepID=A0A068XYG4_ECHMU|nr:delta aminolevulinic acid dehydratase [Echinococcus multilocularis]
MGQTRAWGGACTVDVNLARWTVFFTLALDFREMSNFSLHSGYNTPLLRYWQSASCTVTGDNLIYPIFISSNDNAVDDVPGLPNQKYLGLNHLVEQLGPLVERGLKCVLLFGVVDVSVKDERGSAADYGKSPVIGALKLLRAQLPSLILACDVCLCAYTQTHRCYISNACGEMDIEQTISRLSEISLNYAKAGAHIIAPSDMSEGRILAIKQILHKNGFSRQVSVMSYAAKFASTFYGPFRTAIGSGDGTTDRKSYQLPPGAAGLAVRTAIRDANEGADIIMVKPGITYLDVIANVRRELPFHPIAAYHVSGEYAMLMAAANAGWIDLKSAALEIILSLRRAGASVIITYLTPYLLDLDLKDVFC